MRALPSLVCTWVSKQQVYDGDVSAWWKAATCALESICDVAQPVVCRLIKERPDMASKLYEALLAMVVRCKDQLFVVSPRSLTS